MLALAARMHTVPSTDSHYSIFTTTKSWRVFYDASIPYFGTQHLPYAIIAIVILITNILIPTLLLLLFPYSIFQFFLNKFPHRWQLITRTSVDSFQGCYKDGIQSNSFDYRFVSAMPFIIRLSLFILYALTLDITFNIFAGKSDVYFSVCSIYIWIHTRMSSSALTLSISYFYWDHFVFVV